MPAPRRALAVSKPQAKSRVGNGKQLWLEKVDGRSIIARRYREILAQVVSDLGNDLSEAQMQIARRAAALAVWCESIEAKLAAGEKGFDVNSFTTAANALRRLFETLGIERRARDVTPDLATYLKSKQQQPKAQAR